MGDEMKSKIVRRSITVGKRKTSITLEDEFWDAFRRIAEQRNLGVGELVEAVMRGKQPKNLSSAIRVFVLEQSKQAKARRLNG